MTGPTESASCYSYGRRMTQLFIFIHAERAIKNFAVCVSMGGHGYLVSETRCVRLLALLAYLICSRKNFASSGQQAIWGRPSELDQFLQEACSLNWVGRTKASRLECELITDPCLPHAAREGRGTVSLSLKMMPISARNLVPATNFILKPDLMSFTRARWLSSRWRTLELC